jgi:hypothetical protein
MHRWVPSAFRFRDRVSCHSAALGYATLILCVLGALTLAGAGRGPGPGGAPRPADPEMRIARRPGPFERNVGQVDPRVRFLSRGRMGTLFLTPNETVLAFRVPSAASNGAVFQPARRGRAGAALPPEMGRRAVLRTRWVGGSADPMVMAGRRLPGSVNYFRGDDPKGWHASVPLFESVRYAGLYPGVDLLYHSRDGQLEHDFVVAPGARLRRRPRSGPPAHPDGL